MRLLGEERHHARETLARRLNEIAVARNELLRQIEDLDAEARVFQQEYNTLYNLDALTADLPSEILELIFMESATSDIEQRRRSPGPSLLHFGLLVSQVSHRWRHIAITTARLWTIIPTISLSDCYENLQGTERSKQRTATFLSRTMPFPFSVIIFETLTYDVDDLNYPSIKILEDILQPIIECLEYCGELQIRFSGSGTLLNILKLISSKHMPVLRSIRLGAMNGVLGVQLEERLFPCGTPNLTTVDLYKLRPITIHHCIPTFSSVTTLRLMGIRMVDASYDGFRGGLMALPLLNHLEMSLFDFFLFLPHLPIVLPTIRSICWHISGYGSAIKNFSGFMSNIRVSSLTTLSLNAQEGMERLNLHTSWISLLQPHHLILRFATSDLPYFESLVGKFSHIERLTLIPINSRHDLVSIDVLCHHADGKLRWPGIQTIAISTVADGLNASLYNTILNSQAAGHPIHTLIFPERSISEGGDTMMKLRELVNVIPFRVDWLTPFYDEDWVFKLAC